MIGPNAQHSYYFYDGPADMRKSFDGLCGLVRNCKLPQKKGSLQEDFEKVLLDKLPDVLSVEQKKHKLKNILQKMKRDGKIKLGDKRQWILDEI